MAENIKTVGVLGTGVIGASWAALFLAHGLKVILSDPAPGAQETFEQFLNTAWATIEKLGLREGASKTNYEFVDDLTSRANEIDFIQENGPERLDLKTALITHLDAHLPPHVPIASSSSGLPASKFTPSCTHAPQRILVAHPFNPPHLIPLVEVVPHPGTSQRTIEVALAFYKRLGKRPIILKTEVPGFVANRLQAAVNNEAYSLISRGVVSAEDLDVAMTNGPGLRWALNGPVAINALGGGGGKEGFGRRLERLGAGIREWEGDMLRERFGWGEREVGRLMEGVGGYLEGVDWEEVGRRRDQGVMGVLRAQEGAGGGGSG